MSTTTVYFNSHFNVLKLIIAAMTRPDEFRFICTYKRVKDVPSEGTPQTDIDRSLGVGRMTDLGLFINEPAEVDRDQYPDYCLRVARTFNARVMLPSRRSTSLSEVAGQFKQAGITLAVPATFENMLVLDHKGKTYASLPAGLVPLPAYSIVNSLTTFDAAQHVLAAKHERLCYKPAVGIFGYGFRIIANRSAGPQPGSNMLTLAQAREELGRAGESFADLMLMQLLPGYERSIDCLAVNGELVCGVIRRKNADGTQLLEANEEVLEHVRKLTRHFGLNGLFNVQFKDDENGVPRLLEINTRLSGGVPYACLSGVVLPYWGLRIAAGTATPKDVPQPKTGLIIPTGNI